MAHRVTEKTRRILLNDQFKNRLYGRISSSKFHTIKRREKATAAALTSDQIPWESERTASDPCFEHLDLTFENPKEAYLSKKNSELVRALLVYNLCSIKPLVQHNKFLLKTSRKLLGATLFEKLMKGTFYGHFVAGEDQERIRPTIMRNWQYGVKSILDYSVEKDISKAAATEAEMASCVPEAQKDEEETTSGPQAIFRAHEEFGDRRENVIAARTYFYEDEEACEENMENFLRGIDAVSGVTNATGFAAIKLTALGRPQLLLQLSEVLTRLRQFYDLMTRTTGGDLNSTIAQKDFERYLKMFQIDRESRKKWFTILDQGQDGSLDLLDWHNLLENHMDFGRLLRVPNLKTGQFEPLVASLSKEEEDRMKRFLKRVDKILRYGKEKDVRVMVDAEQTYFQVAINRLVIEMMRKYNQEKAIVFNTYQCYLKEAHNMITLDLALSAREDFYFGAKLVRGAYMEQERKRAETLSYEDPINPTFNATTAMYEKVLCEVMEQIKIRPKGKIAVMIASHNEDTVRYTIEKMKQQGIHANDRVICFGQLLGMCDHVSFPLGQAGYSVYKYVPYGPVEEVLPYLSRRAMENGGILEKIEKEKTLARQELFRRLRAGQIFYKPPTASSPASQRVGQAV